jgi:hypothetical protein
MFEAVKFMVICYTALENEYRHCFKIFKRIIKNLFLERFLQISFKTSLENISAKHMPKYFLSYSAL